MTRRHRRPERERSRFTPIRCEGCGGLLTPTRAWHRHCRDACRARANRAKREQAIRAELDRLTRLVGCR